MPIFEKKEGKLQTREILDIIFDMLSSDVPEAKILSMLEEMGMGDEEARQTLSAAKAKYEALVQSSLSAAVDKLLSKEKEELMERVDSKVESLRKDLLLKVDMNSPEQRKYIEDRISEVNQELNTLKNDLFSTKVEVNTRLKTVEEQAGVGKKRTGEVLISVVFMIAGIIVLFYGLNQMRELVLQFEFQKLTDIFLYLIVVLIGLVISIVGWKKYPHEIKEYKPAGMEYVK
jgi:hypothetical protein